MCVTSCDQLLKLWDLRKPAAPSLVMNGHSDTITCLSLSPDGSYALSNSMDNTLRIWDVRPYAPGERCLKVRNIPLLEKNRA